MPRECPLCAAPIDETVGSCPACDGAIVDVPPPTALASTPEAPTAPIMALPELQPQSSEAPLAPPPPVPAAETASPTTGSQSTRRDERFSVPTDVRLRRLGPDGVIEKEERTIAHDLSRRGMQVLTSWTDLQVGDSVAIEEVGGSLSRAAMVRHVHRGADFITRAGIEFVENGAPDRLFGTSTAARRPGFTGVHSGAKAASSASSSSSSPWPHSAPSPIVGPSATSSISRPVLPRTLPSPVPPLAAASLPSTPAKAPERSPESVLEEIASARASAKGLIAESKIWEALDCLAKAQALAEGSSEAAAISLYIWETQARVPTLMRAAQQNLENLARSEPTNVAAHSALGRFFWRVGVSARARLAFKQVLALDPSNREATAALAALSDPTRPR